MKLPKRFFQSALLLLAVAFFLRPAPLLHAADAPEPQNSTQAILKHPGFREGLVWIGTNEPAAVESDRLWAIVSNLHQPSWTAEVEGFLAQYPASPWAASLHHAYAAFCRQSGRTTKALAHWEAGWELVKRDRSESGRIVGSGILTEWMTVLSSLGRLDKLRELVAAGDAWQFANRRQREKFIAAKDAFYRMQKHPELSYRCGTFALKAVGQQLQPGKPSLESLVDQPSPVGGFTLEALLAEAERQGLGLAPVQRLGTAELIVPSVIHWKQEHYAAILEHKGDEYLVSDPTFGGPRWFRKKVIDEEASGAFLVPTNRLTAGWASLSKEQTSRIHGKGQPNDTTDKKDKGCRREFSGDKTCPPCKGMPVAWASEPWINVWIADEPISYLNSRGEAVTFRLSYKQRDTRPDNPAPYDLDYFPVTGWNHSWFSYIRLEASTPCSANCAMPDYTQSDATLYLPDGGEVSFPAGQRYDSETQLLLQLAASNLQGAGDDGDNGLRVIHADGSQEVYGFGLSYGIPYEGSPTADFALTRRIDAHGNRTFFSYESDGRGGDRLKTVIDIDGRTNTLSYLTTSTNSLLTGVTNGYGLSASFKYDSLGNLTNITDAAGLSSSITYDTNGLPTSMTTPYGTTTFVLTENYQNGEGNFGGFEQINRAVQIVEPTGATNLYMYRYDSAVLMATNYPANDVPTNTPLGTLDSGTGGTNNLISTSFRNSFYWGPRQFGGLSTANMYSFTANDYLRGRMRHWLQDTNDLSLSDLLSVERDPSPDGSTEGLKIFYDYQGKIYNHRAGTNSLPSVMAWRLPGGETHYEYLRFDNFGNVTNHVSTYSKADGSMDLRTNQFIYAVNTYTNVLGSVDGSGALINGATNTFSVPNLLTKVIAADGSNVWSFGGFDGVTWSYDFVNFGTNRALLSSQRVLPNYLTNGVGGVSQLFYSGFNHVAGLKGSSGLTTSNYFDGSGFLWRTADVEIGRTNSFGYTTNGMVGVFTNALGLVVNVTWDNLLRLKQVAFPDSSYISNYYGGLLDVLATRDRLTNWSYFSYDGLQHLTAATNANQAVTRLSWCGCGSLETISNALNQATTLTHDNQSRLTVLQRADGSSVTYGYDLAGRVTSVADGAGRTLTYGYNNQGQATSATNAYGRVWRVLYDVRDRPIEFTDANNVTVTNKYDNLDRLVSRSYPSGGGAEGLFWSTNGLRAYTNQDQRVTWFNRDAAFRLLSVTNAKQEVVWLNYNSLDEVTDLWDGNSNHTSWAFNQYGWLMGKTNALREALRFGRDANGQVTNRWTPEFGNSTYARDALGNVTNIGYSSSSIGYAYDALNRVASMVDAVGTNVFTYSQANQLLTEDGPWSNDIVTNSYSQRLRTTLAINPSSPSLNLAYGYDSAWRLGTIASQSGTFTYGYGSSAGALVRTIGLPNAAYVTNHFDGLNRLDYTALVNHWGHVLDGSSYTHDPLGLRTNIVRDLGLTTNSVTVGYDGIEQLVSWKGTESGGSLRLNEQLGFGFDHAHNLQSRTNGSLVQTFNVDRGNELTNITRTGTLTVSGSIPAPATSIAVNGVTAERYGDLTFAATNLSLGTTNTFTTIAQNTYGTNSTNITISVLPSSLSLAYDSNGNLTNDGTRSFSFDAENQLTNVNVAGGWKSEFVYDGFGRRRIAKDYAWQSNAWVKTNESRFVYDRFLIVQERDSNNVAQVTYTRGLDLSGSLDDAGGIGGLLARTDASGSTFYHADGAGNVTALIDSQQNIAARYLYNPFGKLTGRSGVLADANVMQFSSMPVHRQSGIVGFLGRGYDPSFQRWIEKDQIGEMGGINLYRLNYNNPLRWIDPDGAGPQLVSLSAPVRNGQVTGPAVPGYIDEKFGDSIRNAKSGPPDEPTLVQADEMFNRAADLSYDPDSSGIDAAQYYLMGVGLGILGTLDLIPDVKLLTKPCAKLARKEFNKLRPKFWKREAEASAEKYGAENLARMREGKPPIGPDGYPMEVHHKIPLANGGDNSVENLQPMTQTDHRLGDNYRLNHPDLH